MSTFQPVSRAASLAFCPSLPMARESCLSGTTATAPPVVGSSSTLMTLEGLRELEM